jgi:hypothetical protein
MRYLMFSHGPKGSVVMSWAGENSSSPEGDKDGNGFRFRFRLNVNLAQILPELEDR